MRIVRELFDVSRLLVSTFNWQTLFNFRNLPLEFIDTDTRDILAYPYLVTPIPA
jgi:hypothetical protein